MIERHFISKTNAQITVKVVIYTCGLVKKKYAFSKVSQYAWVLNTQMSDFHKGLSLSFLPRARGYFTWF